jgi:hypothetical protein
MTILGVCFLVAATALTALLPSIWRGSNRRLNTNWATGSDAVRACYRAVVPSLIGVWALGIASTVGTGADWRSAVTFVCVSTLLFVSLPLMISVWYWNKPRFVVPPPWRDS